VLRELGIPSAAVADIDILKEGGSNWTNLLSGASVPTLSHQPMGSLRAAIKKEFEDAGLDMKRDGGISALPAQACESAHALLNQLADYGIFVVPGGEVESWLRQLGCSGHGPSWLISIFEKMETDPGLHSYLRPTEDGVWAFVATMRRWLVNPGRLGIAP
jgi:hypothetical protein